MRKKNKMIFEELVHIRMFLGDIRKLLELERKRYKYKRDNKTMTEQISYNLEYCLKCSAWIGNGCSLTACSRTKTYIYIDGKCIEL